MGYLMQKTSLWYYSTHSCGDKGVHIFPKGICMKVNVIVEVEFELSYFEAAVQHFIHYATETQQSCK